MNCKSTWMAVTGDPSAAWLKWLNLDYIYIDFYEVNDFIVV